ncbi:SEC-C domain-containing protein [Sunxiuqinia elliptica]|uniref:SEC-C motif-containing protein n=1 Tax=Sunxiuqinia elliptica TaxID=655355 RepID=A0A4R6HAK0_9BACT|nr:SEC-C domain-containing protein [Sunxiuqinia elliptica]TDO05392.1 hypothetical protein DET52_101752 [Sunxiuqinia elliptica]TDO64939.1 hypothetical protein DET65_1311 [Sunxiuqinia elliptica]
MNIVITIDKSTFQSLSFPELMRLSSYYEHNVAPVLVMEILGDLKKERQEGETPSDIRVKDFATKLFPMYSVVNAYYRTLVKGELSGDPVKMDGRPTLDIEKVIQPDDHRKGMVVRETAEEKAIYKWKDGKFTDADDDLSQLWRNLTTHENLLKNLQKILQATEHEKLKSFDQLDNKVNSILSDHSLQDRLLAYMIDNYGEGEIDGVSIFNRWIVENRPLLTDFAPYTAYCLKVELLFHFGLQSELIGTLPTNQVDLEYLYYLPFCNVFTSNDKIHKQLVPLLVREDQQFIVGTELKKDFKQIVDYLEKEGEEVKKKFVNEPPILEDSLTYGLWEKYFDYPKSGNMNRNLSEEALSKMKSTMDKVIKASEGEAVDFDEGEAEEFVVKKSYLSMNDPCYCGSGKKVIDCCIPKEEFLRLSQKNKNQ